MLHFQGGAALNHRHIRMQASPGYNLMEDNLQPFAPGPAFVAFGEVMIRDTPADQERPERTRLVHLSTAGSEYSVCIGLARLGIPSAYITRLPDNPYGWAVRNLAREQGVNVEHLVWAEKTDLLGRMIYERGRTPRHDSVIYQRKHSAASQLDAGMVDWKAVLKEARLFHTSGITFGLAAHSGYARNHNLEAFKEAMTHKPANCLVGLDFNYRSTLWPMPTARDTLAEVLGEFVDILITSVPDMAQFYGITCGRHSTQELLSGEAPLEDDDLRAFAEQICRRFDLKIVAVTLRHADSLEQHRWESAAADAAGTLARSAIPQPIAITDRLGGGDAWTAGFYYGLLTEAFSATGLAKGVVVGDACAQLKQTLMFDLPILDRHDVQALIGPNSAGGYGRVSR